MLMRSIPGSYSDGHDGVDMRVLDQQKRIGNLKMVGVVSIFMVS